MWWVAAIACVWIGGEEHARRVAANHPFSDTDLDSEPDSDTDFDTDTDTGTPCVPTGPEVCGNDLDDDCDGATDCRLGGTSTGADAKLRVTDPDGAIGHNVAVVSQAGGTELLLTRASAPQVAFVFAGDPFTGELSTTAADGVIALPGESHAVPYLWPAGDRDHDGKAEVLATWDKRGKVDGQLWLLEAPFSPTQLPILEIKGTKHSGLGITEGPGPPASGVDDFDGDGLADLAAVAPATTPGGSLFVYSGESSGTISSLDAESTFNGQAGDWLDAPVLDIGDADGDGLADVAVYARGAQSVYVLRGSAAARDGLANDFAPLRVNGATGAFARCDGPTLAMAHPDGVALLPLDGEGVLDPGNDALGHFGSTTPVSGLVCASIDGDATPDLLVVESTSVDAYYGPLQRTATEPDFRLLLAAHTATTADLNGDGVRDVIVGIDASVLGFLGHTP